MSVLLFAFSFVCPFGYSVQLSYRSEPDLAKWFSGTQGLRNFDPSQNAKLIHLSAELRETLVLSLQCVRI